MRERISARDPAFREAVQTWLRSTPELLVLNRLTRAAGQKDWFLVRSLADLELIVDRARPSDCLTVFSGPQLPYRGRSSEEETTTRGLELVSQAEESVFGEIVDGDPQLRDAIAAVPGDEDWVAEWLADRPGSTVAFGPYPPFLSDDPSVAIDGIVPLPDGSLVPGVY